MEVEVISYYIGDVHWQHGKVGIFYHDEDILSSSKKPPDEERDYKFSLLISRRISIQERIKAFKAGEDDVFKRCGETERIIFYHKLNIRSLLQRKSYVSIDSEKLKAFVQEVQPALYKKLVKRIRRNYLNKIPNVVLYESSDLYHKYGDGKIFIEFEKQSAYCLSGPFEYKNKLGGLVDLSEKEYVNPRFIDLETEYNHYNIPYVAEEIISNHKFYDLTPEQKKELFNSFSIKQRHEIYKSVLRHTADKESVECMLPFRIYLMGNDDTSYSKWFFTKEEQEAELNYLLKMQPLDFFRDIIDRDYIFTN